MMRWLPYNMIQEEEQSRINLLLSFAPLGYSCYTCQAFIMMDMELSTVSVSGIVKKKVSNFLEEKC